jgi:flagellin
MPAVINTNMASLYAQRSLSTSQAEMAVQVNALASGKRINSARDDGAGLAVSEAAKSSNSIATRSIQNLQDAISIVQIADGSLNVVGKMLQRVLTLTTQKENSVLSTNQKGSINTEIASLLNEIEKIRSRSQFQNSSSVFNTSKSFSAGDGVSTNVNIAYLGLGDDVAKISYAQFYAFFVQDVPQFDSDGAYIADANLNTVYGAVQSNLVGNPLYFGDNVAGIMAIDAVEPPTSINPAPTHPMANFVRIKGDIATMTSIFQTYQLAHGYTNAVMDFNFIDPNTDLPMLTIQGADWWAANFTFGKSSGLGLVDSYQQPSLYVARGGLIANTDYYNTNGSIKTLTAASVDTLSSANIKMAIGRNTNNMAEVGTTQNRLGYIVDNLQTLSNNLIDAQGRITDVDYASVTAGFTRGLILQQAGSAMVAQANQSGRVMLALLK